MNIFESEPYGAVVSETQLKTEIKRRRQVGIPIMGEGVMYLGGEIIRENGGERLECVDGKIVVFDIKVYPTGLYKLFPYLEESDSSVNPPPRWEVIENP